jgi:hypothetical protein
VAKAATDAVIANTAITAVCGHRVRLPIHSSTIFIN